MRVPPISFLFLLLPALAHAQAGSLDPSFGSGGYIIFSMGPQHDETLDAALQPDGCIVACGYRTDGDLNAHVFVGRYLPDGTPDASFGPEGLVEVDLGPDDARGTAIAVRPDGKIVVEGVRCGTTGSRVHAVHSPGRRMLPRAVAGRWIRAHGAPGADALSRVRSYCTPP